MNERRPDMLSFAADLARGAAPFRQTATIREDREITREEIAAIVDACAGYGAIAAECAALIVANCDDRHKANATVGILRAMLDLHDWHRHAQREPELEHARRRP